MLTKRLVFSIYCLICIISTAIATACINSSNKPFSERGDPVLDNSDVIWHGTFFGLEPQISERADRYLKDITRDDEKWLLKNLMNKDRFAICHVILVFHWGPPFEVTDNYPLWYGMSVQLESSKKTKYKIEYKTTEREKLYEIWAKALGDPKSRLRYGKVGPIDDPFKGKSD